MRYKLTIARKKFRIVRYKLTIARKKLTIARKKIYIIGLYYKILTLFFTIASLFVTRICAFRSCSSGEKIHIARCILTIVRQMSELWDKMQNYGINIIYLIYSVVETGCCLTVEKEMDEIE